MTEQSIRFWLEVGFWALLIGGILNGQRLMHKRDCEQLRAAAIANASTSEGEGQ